MIRIEKARSEDSKALALASWRAFANDVNYGAPGVGGPPGYKSDRWQSKMIRIGKYYKILADTRIIGGFIVFDQGIGTQAIEFMEKTFPQVRRWTLGTPRWNLRTQHFYEKIGYVRVGIEEPDGYRYEKLQNT
jgi:hypothetical protein